MRFNLTGRVMGRLDVRALPIFGEVETHTRAVFGVNLGNRTIRPHEERQP
jgi:hypothetical protein